MFNYGCREYGDGSTWRTWRTYPAGTVLPNFCDGDTLVREGFYRPYFGSDGQGFAHGVEIRKSKGRFLVTQYASAAVLRAAHPSL